MKKSCRNKMSRVRGKEGGWFGYLMFEMLTRQLGIQLCLSGKAGQAGNLNLVSSVYRWYLRP